MSATENSPAATSGDVGVGESTEDTPSARAAVPPPAPDGDPAASSSASRPPAGLDAAGTPPSTPSAEPSSATGVPSAAPPAGAPAGGSHGSPQGGSQGGPPALTLRVWLGFMSMVVGMFMAILDIQIVASSLSEIQAGLAASSDEIAWVQTAYLVAEVVMIPLSGMLSRMLSTRVLFTIAAAGFTISSAACAFTSGIETMIVWRAIQGFIGGAMIPTVFATSFILFPPERRAGVMVMIGLVATMAPTLGPTLGGWLTETLSWHWLFLANVLPGIAVTTLVWMLVDVDKPNPALRRGFDFIGLILMALFLGSLEYVVEEGPRQDWFSDQSVAIFAVIAAVGGVGFFVRVLTYHNPIVELRAFMDRNFAIGSLYSFVIGVGLYGAVYLQPLFLARVRGYNSLQIGTIMFVTGAFQFISSPLAGALSKKMDLRLMLAMGLCMFGGAVYLNSGLTNQTSFWELFFPQALRGLSLMFCFLPVNTIALGTLRPDQLKNASGLYNLMRNLGGAIGLAVINTVLLHREALHMNRLGDNINLARPLVQDTLDGLAARFDGLVADPQAAALKTLARMVEREATVMTFNDAFMLMAAVFLGGLLFMPLVRKPGARAGGGGH